MTNISNGFAMYIIEFFFKYMVLEYQKSCNYFPMLIPKILRKRKEKETLKIIRSYGEKKLRMVKN